MSLKVSGSDSDGYVSSISISWGDGNMTDVPYSLSACTDPESSAHSESRSHSYVNAGSYNITVTVTSVNCAGDTAQAQSAFAYAGAVTGGTATPPVTTVNPGDN